MPTAEVTKLIEAKMSELNKELEKRKSPEEQVRFLLMIVAAQSVVLDGAIGQLRDEILAVRMCVPKADHERAVAAVDKATKETHAEWMKNHCDCPYSKGESFFHHAECGVFKAAGR